MVRFSFVVFGVCAICTFAQAEIDRGDCRVAGSSLQFCDPSGVACTTSKGTPGTCVQRPNGCQCVPGRGQALRDFVEICHFGEDAGVFVGIRVRGQAARRHLENHPRDCLVDADTGCLDGVCDPELGCIQVINEHLCDDGVFCNGRETCDPETGDCVAVSACPPHIDGCKIINGECDEENDTCVEIIDPTLCDDGQFCNGRETCDEETGACVAVSACPPSIEGCKIINGECDEVNDTCVDIVDPTLCDDGQFCNGRETCDPDTGACVAVSACPPSIEGCKIINGECDEVNDTCVDIIDPTLCDDGQFCNGLETCDEETGACVAVSACPPHVVNDCLVINGECDEDNDVCRDVLNDNFCDDENDCTRDFCIEGGFCASEAQCSIDADCTPDPCIVGFCSADGCCSAITACPPSAPACTRFTGGCDPDTGICEVEIAADGTPCDPLTGGLDCGNGCDGACFDGACEPIGPPRCPCFTFEDLMAIDWAGAECDRGNPDWLIQARQTPEPNAPLNQAISTPELCSLLVQYGPTAPQDIFAVYTDPAQGEECTAIIREVQDLFCPLP